MYCTKCRNEIKNSDVFCYKCGTPTSHKNDSSANQVFENASEVIIPKIDSCEKCNNPKRLVFQNRKYADKQVCITCDTTPGSCPLCNKKLRTEKAEQCGACISSWRKDPPQTLSPKIQISPPATKKKLKCPKCSSEELTSNKKGFSGKQAVGGAILTGGIGILAGTIGSNKIIITCLACGNQFKPGEDLHSKRKKQKQEEEAMNSPIFWIVFIGFIIFFFWLFRGCF